MDHYTPEEQDAILSLLELHFPDRTENDIDKMIYLCYQWILNDRLSE